MNGTNEYLHSTFTWIYEHVPHHPLFLFVFSVFTLLKIYCTICVVIEHIKIRNYQSKIILINGVEEKSFASLLAIKCAKKGMDVLATCRTSQSLYSLNAVTINGKGTITGILMDPTEEASVLELKLRIQNEVIAKGKELFAIVNCPGPLTVGHDDELSIEDYVKSMEESFYSLIRVVHAFKPMLKKSRGRIINLSSVHGKFALPGLGPHCLVNACIEMYSDVLRRELEPHGVKTIVVQAGFLRGANQVVASLTETWAKVSHSGELDGGKESRQKVLDHIKAKENSIFHCPPECWTTACLFNAIVSAFPRRRYVIGFANLLFYTPISLLSANFQDLCLRFYWFLSWFPRAACVECTQKQKTANSIEC